MRLPACLPALLIPGTSARCPPVWACGPMCVPPCLPPSLPPSLPQIFHVRDMACLPGPADVRPYARMTAPLAVNNLSALLPTLVATSAATALGVQHLGAHTILRQVMGFWLQVRGGARAGAGRGQTRVGCAPGATRPPRIAAALPQHKEVRPARALPFGPRSFPPALPCCPQLFIAFNATAHSLIANSLSRQREGRAAEVLVRIAQLAVAVSLPLAAALFAGRGLLPDLFTEDVLVQREVAEVLPFLLLLMVRRGGG